MANLKNGRKNLNLMAVFTDKQVTYNKETGQPSGAFLDIQIDQSDLSEDLARQGKGDPNPHIENVSVSFRNKNGQRQTMVEHTRWYNMNQLNMMREVGYESVSGNTHAIQFNGTVTMTKSREVDGSEGMHVIVVCPTNKNMLKPSIQTENAIACQNRITKLVSDSRRSAQLSVSREKTIVQELDMMDESDFV